MDFAVPITQLILGLLLVLSSIGVIVAKRPIYASLSFLLSLIILASIYLQLSAEFIAVMQILVYAGAILVIFIFVIVLFQDAYQQIDRYPSKSNLIFLVTACIMLMIALILLAIRMLHPLQGKEILPDQFGTAEGLGQALYFDFFFPFEAIIMLFLTAIVGSLYIAKKEG